MSSASGRCQPSRSMAPIQCPVATSCCPARETPAHAVVAATRKAIQVIFIIVFSSGRKTPAAAVESGNLPRRYISDHRDARRGPGPEAAQEPAHHMVERERSRAGDGDPGGEHDVRPLLEPD